jgi:hypothetical protein
VDELERAGDDRGKVGERSGIARMLFVEEREEEW